MITRALYKVLESPTSLLFSIMYAILHSQTIIKVIYICRRYCCTNGSNILLSTFYESMVYNNFFDEFITIDAAQHITTITSCCRKSWPFCWKI